MEKIDYKKRLKHLYGPTAKTIDIVDIPEMNFLMVDGEGDPNTARSFSDAIEALYPIAYSLKFTVKRSGTGIDYWVLPLEALWWADDMSAFSLGNKKEWKWTVMIMQPDFITREMVGHAIQEVGKKKRLVSLPLVRFDAFKEGKAAQTLHIGPFAEE